MRTKGNCQCTRRLGISSRTSYADLSTVVNLTSIEVTVLLSASSETWCKVHRTRHSAWWIRSARFGVWLRG